MRTIPFKHFALRTLVFTFLMMLLTIDTRAQDAAQGSKDRTPEQRAQALTTMMKDKLNLDSAQVLKVQDINLKYAQKLDPVLKGDGRRFAKFRQMRSIQSDKDKELKTVLSKDQYKQYQQLEAEMKDKLKDAAQSRKQ